LCSFDPSLARPRNVDTGLIMPGSQWRAALLPPLLLLAALCQGSRLPGNPQADPKSVVVSASGTVRFTDGVLADGLLRIEYSATRSFNDQQAMVVWNRRPGASLTTNTTQIATALAVRLVDRGVAPTADTLQITVL
jgi:hypothetical protein